MDFKSLRVPDLVYEQVLNQNMLIGWLSVSLGGLVMKHIKLNENTEK